MDEHCSIYVVFHISIYSLFVSYRLIILGIPSGYKRRSNLVRNCKSCASGPIFKYRYFFKQKQCFIRLRLDSHFINPNNLLVKTDKLVGFFGRNFCRMIGRHFFLGLSRNVSLYLSFKKSNFSNCFLGFQIFFDFDFLLGSFNIQQG